MKTNNTTTTTKTTAVKTTAVRQGKSATNNYENNNSFSSFLSSFGDVDLSDEAESVLADKFRNIKIKDLHDVLCISRAGKKDIYLKIIELSHTESDEDLGPFWGLNTILTSEEQYKCKITLVDSACAYSTQWVNQHRDIAESTVSVNLSTQTDDGTITEAEQANRDADDVLTIASELLNGHSYINNTHYLLISSTSTRNIKEYMKFVTRYISTRIHNIVLNELPDMQYFALQSIVRDGLNGLPSARKAHWSMTSAKYAGYYNLFASTIKDVSGEYIGVTMDDIIDSPVIFDFDLFDRCVCVADSSKININNNIIHMCDYVMAKIESAALFNNKKVIHININPYSLVSSRAYKSITTHISGDNPINPFEIFGNPADVLSLFPAHIKKMTLLFSQLAQGDETSASIMAGNLADILTQFYVDNGMWRYDAQNKLDDLRVIGIPHSQVPRLRDFVPYLEERYKAATSANQDHNQVSALNVLRLTFNQLLSSNGALFDRETADIFDKSHNTPVLTFDLSEYMRISKDVAMAQLINIISTACSYVSDGDILMIHGADQLNADVFEYLQQRLDTLTLSGGRYVLSFNTTDETALKCVCNSDYSIIGKLSGNDLVNYSSLLNESFSDQLSNSLTSMPDDAVFIKRLNPNNQALCKLVTRDIVDLYGFTKKKGI